MRSSNPLPQTFRIAETRLSTRTGTTRAMPDDRIMLTLDDGRSFLVAGERMRPRPDGTYQVDLFATDELLDAPPAPG